MNLCMPDAPVACAACCGLYNLADARRSTLQERLTYRTRLFVTIPRSVDAIVDFATSIRAREAPSPRDSVIHVCEFVGFLDASGARIGCMLHPFAPGNRGLDLRGLCHYGSMACKAFFCPAHSSLPEPFRTTTVACLDHWHLFGLVATDMDFVLATFGLIAEVLELDPGSLSADVLRGPRVMRLVKEAFSWKDHVAFAGAGRVRWSRYFEKPSLAAVTTDSKTNSELIRDCLAQTYGIPVKTEDWDRFMMRRLQEMLPPPKPGIGRSPESCF